MRNTNTRRSGRVPVLTPTASVNTAPAILGRERARRGDASSQPATLGTASRWRRSVLAAIVVCASSRVAAVTVIVPTACTAGDENGDGQVSIDELVTAVKGALDRCA